MFWPGNRDRADRVFLSARAAAFGGYKLPRLLGKLADADAELGVFGLEIGPQALAHQRLVGDIHRVGQPHAIMLNARRVRGDEKKTSEQHRTNIAVRPGRRAERQPATILQKIGLVRELQGTKVKTLS